MANTFNAITTGTGGIATTGDSSGAFSFTKDGGSSEVYIDSSGNVGIGTSSPSSALYVKRTSGSSGLYVDYNGTNVGRFEASSNGNLYIGTTTGSGAIGLGTTASPNALYIDSSGNVLVGATSGSAKINTFVNSSQVGFYQNKPSTGNADHQQFYTDGTLFAKMTNRGSWYNYDNVYGSLSDATLKENISDATPKLNDLMQVEVRNFNFIADENKTKQLGVIAQELETVFPSMVDTDEDGIKSVKYSVFVPMLIKAIQELKAELDTVKSELATLKGLSV